MNGPSGTPATQATRRTFPRTRYRARSLPEPRRPRAAEGTHVPGVAPRRVAGTSRGCARARSWAHSASLEPLGGARAPGGHSPRGSQPAGRRAMSVAVGEKCPRAGEHDLRPRCRLAGRFHAPQDPGRGPGIRQDWVWGPGHVAGRRGGGASLPGCSRRYSHVGPRRPGRRAVAERFPRQGRRARLQPPVDAPPAPPAALRLGVHVLALLLLLFLGRGEGHPRLLLALPDLGGHLAGHGPSAEMPAAGLRLRRAVSPPRPRRAARGPRGPGVRAQPRAGGEKDPAAPRDPGPLGTVAEAAAPPPTLQPTAAAAARSRPAAERSAGAACSAARACSENITC